MLILSRKIGEAVVLGENITVRVIEVSKGVVRIGFEAPDDILILREELKREVEQANIEAKNSTLNIEEVKGLSKKFKKK